MLLSKEFLLMILTYVITTAVFAYLAVKYARMESAHVSETKVGRRCSSVSRLVFLLKITWCVVKNSLTIIILTTVILASLISAYSATSHASYVAFSIKKKFPFAQAVLIEFRQITSKDNAQKILSMITKRNDKLRAEVVWYARHVLSKPLKLRYGDKVYHVYVLLGLNRNEIKKYFNVTIYSNGYDLLYSGVNPGLKINATLMLVNGSIVKVTVIGVPASALRSREIIPDVPLLPVQSYVGTRPVTPPPKYVLIGSISMVNSLLGMPRSAVTDALVLTRAEYLSLHALMQLASSDYISRIWFFTGQKLFIVSITQIPTAESMITALLSSVTATILCLAVASSILPNLRNLYLRLSIQGMPPWGTSMINTAYTILVVLVPGTMIVSYSYYSLGGVSAFNSLISVVIIWAFMLAYVNMKSKPPKLRTDVYLPPSPRYVTILSRMKPADVIHEISESLRENEFFEILELESRIQGNEAAMHARLIYVESWGVGADVNILVTSNNDERTYVDISCMIWGIEEVSEAVMNNVLAVLLSKIIGRLKSWELQCYL